MSFLATPVTVLTGFLGAGKTTFLNHLLRQAGRRLAVIENEYGEVGVDSELIERTANETIVQLDNGCVCCTVRGDLANALTRLVRERESGAIAFDHVVIETTGLADPGPVTRTFMSETALIEHFYLDGVITLVDAMSGSNILEARREARAQVAYADRIIITKCDLASPEDIQRLEGRLRHMNRLARIERGDRVELSTEGLDTLLEIKGFQWDKATWGCQDASATPCSEGHESCEGNHDLTNGDTHESNHCNDVVSLHWQSEVPIDPKLFGATMAALEDFYPEALWRVKGILNVHGYRQRVVAQGVNGLLQLNPTTYWRPFEQRLSRLILIGENLDEGLVRAMLDRTVVDSGALAGLARKPEDSHVDC